MRICRRQTVQQKLDLRLRKYIIKHIRAIAALGSTMRKMAVILNLLFIAGCGKLQSAAPVSRFDSAIERLSRSEQELEWVSKEKDYFIKFLEDRETQKAEYGYILDNNRLCNQMKDFARWHEDISQRERELAILHAINVFAAHNQTVKHKSANHNQIRNTRT